MRLFQNLCGSPARMACRSKGRGFQAAGEEIRCCLSKNEGNILVYIVVVMLIFAALGATMLSLFSTATSSSATPNDDRRALYLKESGGRYALSELRNTEFDDDVLDALNTTTYDLKPSGNFTINVFGPWFESAETKSIPAGGGDLDLKIPNGRLVYDWYPLTPSYLWVVNYENNPINLDEIYDETMVRNQVLSLGRLDDTTLRIYLDGDFEVRKDDRVCLAVWPTHAQTLTTGGDLYVDETAKDFFPAVDGAINIKTIDYVYKRLVWEQANSRVKLENVSASAMPNTSSPFPLTVDFSLSAGIYTGDFVLLSPRNFLVIPTGTAGTVSVGGRLDDSLNIVDFSTTGPGPRRPDIGADEFTSHLSQKETDSSFVGLDTDNDRLDIGAGVTQAASQFGAAWYSGDLTVGGSPSFCQAGECKFGRGIRAFFLLTYSGAGEGLTFSLLNGALNSNTSVGGDKDLPELLAYAGDSRQNTTGTVFLDGSGTGLRAPKMALEFDTRPNSTRFEYCSGAATSDYYQNTRNDPSGRDAVQYVFWGFDTSLDIACRSNKVSYDDNRHDSGENLLQWPSPPSTSGIIRSTPTVGPDGTIYVGSNSGRLFAYNPDGSLKWRYPSIISIGAVVSSPVVGSNGVVYVGSDNGQVYGIDASTGLQVYASSSVGAAVRGSPVIGAGGRVYIGAENSKFYGFSSDLSTRLWEFTMGGPISYGRPPVSASGIIYISHRGNTSGRLYAINPATRELATPPAFPNAATGEWEYNIIDGSERMAGIDPDTGMIYTNSGGTKIIALRPDGTQAWEFVFDADMDSSPVVGPDGTVYFGADNAILYAINPQDRNNGLTFPTAREWSAYADSGIDCTPAIASDGTIIVSSSSGNLYAFYPGYPDNTKWYRFLGVSSVSDGAGADARPNSSPAIGNNGTIYIGSSDNRLYALNNFAVPRNFKDKLVAGAADLNLGPWAVRMEVDRSQTANGSGNYEYTLHSWVRQCSQMDCRDELGTFFENTRVKYSARTPHIEQTVELNPTQHDNFTRLLFGFTGAVATGDDQRARIDKFQLSFIRFNDPEITTDPDWP